jgi:large subunit ribosomal protein L24e
LTWTQAWRRKNKKGKIETAAKKKGKRSARVFKSIQGITIEDIKKRRDAKPDLKKAQRDNALRYEAQGGEGGEAGLDAGQ